MIDYLIDIDSSVFIYLNGLHCNFFDTFMKLFSSRYIWIPMYIAIVYMMTRKFSLGQFLIMAIGVTLTITIADQLCASVIRPIFERLRPSNIDNPLSEITHIVNNYRGGAYGFPSCHAANSFALAIFSTMMFRQKSFTIIIISWAIINSYSRIYLGVHYPGDLVVGAIIGATIAFMSFRIASLCCNKWASQSDTSDHKHKFQPLHIFYIVVLLTIIYILLSSILTISL